MGSADRRTASALIYSYFRLGKACAGLPAEERLMLALFLCGTSTEFLAASKSDLAKRQPLELSAKIAYLEEKYAFRLYEVFPFTAHLSGDIEATRFLHSFFIQPDLFIRPHTGKHAYVLAKLNEAGITHYEEDGAIGLANGTKLEQVFPDEKPFEVQDISSQRTGQLFNPSPHEQWWDACAASGGKSILLCQQQPQVKLLVSDIRDSVLANLDERFRAAGIRNYHKKQLDLTQNQDLLMHHYEFDGIILDAPCTGSGTWGRTPEMISQFNESMIERFAALQKTIAANVIKYLKPGKPLIYITCSVFKEENQEVTNFLVKEDNLKLEKEAVLTGYEHRADTMYAARLIKPM